MAKFGAHFEGKAKRSSWWINGFRIFQECGLEYSPNQLERLTCHYWDENGCGDSCVQNQGQCWSVFWKVC